MEFPETGMRRIALTWDPRISHSWYPLAVPFIVLYCIIIVVITSIVYALLVPPYI